MTTEPRLFPDAAPLLAIREKSADRRRTERRRGMLEAGVHPATRELLADNGETCGSCGHFEVHFSRPGTAYFKCGLMGDSRGPGTDIRKRWPACAKWRCK